jgi:tetratricopeptide (TPR) repeat protein
LGEGQGEGLGIPRLAPDSRKSAVDIIIPCYNTGQYLKQAIDSALAQTYPHINVLVVDDGSTDDTREIVQSYEGRVEYFYQENKGLPAARNAGISRTHAEFVCLLDADDVILPHMIQDQLNELEQDGSVDITHGKTLAFDEDDIAHPYAEIWRPQCLWSDYIGALSVICAIHLGSSLVRRTCFQRFGLLTQELTQQGCEDWAFWLNCALHGAVFRHVPRVHGLYRQHPRSMSSSEQAIASRESELIKLAARMFGLSSVSDARRLKVLSCGIRSIAARWLPLGERERFEELLELSNHVLASSEQEIQMDKSFPCSWETPFPLIYLALSKEFLDLGLEELAVVMFIRCGDIKTLKDECDLHRQSELFKNVVGSLAAATSANEIPHRSEPYAILNDRLVGARHASPLQETSEFYLELERIIPHHASFHGYVKHQLGILEESRGNLQKAEKEFSDSIALNPNYSFAHYDLGRLLEARGDYRGAESELRRAVELKPDFLFARTDLARVLAAKHDYLAAEQELIDCLALDPSFALGILDHAKVLAKMGKYGAAVSEFLRASRIDPGATRDYIMGWLKSILGI